MREIKDDDIITKGMASLDEVGQCFIYHGEFYRGIYPDKVNEIKMMFSSGLVDSLVNEGFIPETEITEYYTKEYPLILKHKKVKVITYDYEWTYDMIKDAALLVLKLMRFLNKYGYKLKDCHTYNILFEDNNPLYVDFGSIVKNSGRGFCSEQFYRNYIMAIQAMNFHGSMGRLMLRAKVGASFSETLAFGIGFKGSYLYYQLIRKFYRIYFKLIDKISWFREVIFKYWEYYLSASNYTKDTNWSRYQAKVDFCAINSLEELPLAFSRYRYIIESLQKMQINSILEFGGNSGGIAILAAKFLDIKKYVCTDYDEKAINGLYKLIKMYEPKYPWLRHIVPVVCDFKEVHMGYQYPTMEQRFSSEAVIAMALTHHLILAQGMDIDSIFERLSACTNKYLYIEFMPLGLWDGNNSPVVPEWYTLEWFKRHMEKYFHIREIKQLEKNRILLIGEK